jgi:formamidopyrimidine-DNA glycosylase
MPELPDVEGFRRELADRLPGRRVRSVDVSDSGVLRNASARSLAKGLVGHRFTSPRRHGKWLVLPTDGPVLLIHSGMTGRPYYVPSTRAGHAGDDRLRIRLDRGELRYADRRKLRGVWLAGDDSGAGEIMGKQGSDALAIDLGGLTDALRGRRGRLKPTLQDQSVIAGLGNLLVDEICWRARLNPARKVADLDADDLRGLHGTMRRTLRTAVRHGCVPGLRGWLTRVRDDESARCPRCRTLLEHGRVGGRGTVWCPRCQPR